MLNCEMGFLIDSPALAQRVSAGFDGPLAQISYQPEISADGRMVWKEAIPGGESVIWQQEPGTSWMKQIALVVIGALPVEWLL